jgi:hypothetical protein
VIDRIAYSAYGEATRTLRSDVNGDGLVNKDDYNGVIRSRLNTTIGSAGYVVEADLDRDGVTGSTAAGSRPWIMDQIHTYDLASNRLSRRDGRAGASWDALGAAGGAFESQSIVSGNCGAHQGTSFPPGAWVATQGGMAGTPFPAAVCSRR